VKKPINKDLKDVTDKDQSLKNILNFKDQKLTKLKGEEEKKDNSKAKTAPAFKKPLTNGANPIMAIF